MERSLASRSGADRFVFTAFHVVGVLMNWSGVLRLKKSAKRLLCGTLVGCSVMLGGRGKSERHMDQTKETATAIVAGAARVILPENKISSLAFIAAGVAKRRSDLINLDNALNLTIT